MKKLGLGKIVAIAATLLGVVALIMLFVPQLAYKSVTGYGKADPLTGLQITFGYSEHDAAILNFSFGNFLTYVLLIVAIVFAVLALLGKLGKIAPVVSAACFVLAGVFFFCAQAFTVVNVGKATGNAANLIKDAFNDTHTLGAGAIVGGILSILAGGAMAAKLFVKD